MREILFRGKRIDDGEWVEGSLVHRTKFYGDTDDRYFIICNGEFHYDYYDAVEVDPKTVGQFTGVLDKNDKKIFEGDVVKTKYGRLCVVVWFSSQVCNCWDLETIRTLDNVRITPPTSIDLFKKCNLEVVGNIHDNPELLEDKN